MMSRCMDRWMDGHTDRDKRIERQTGRQAGRLTVSDLKYSKPLNWSTVHHLLFQPVLSLPVL